MLRDPVYDEVADEITYTVSVLESYEGDGLGEVVARVADGTLPQTVGAGALFIDSLGCKDSVKACRRYRKSDACSNEPLIEDGHLAGTEQSTNTCHVAWEGCNYPCDRDYYDGWCNTNFSDWCYAYHSWGCVFATDSRSGTCSDAL